MIRSKTLQWIVGDKLENRNTEYLTYLGDWDQTPVLDGAYLQYNITSTSPSQIDASVSLAFTGMSDFLQLL
jgi:hypothetical protein